MFGIWFMHDQCLTLRFFFSSRRRHTSCALVTGVQTCALPICLTQFPERRPFHWGAVHHAGRRAICRSLAGLTLTEWIGRRPMAERGAIAFEPKVEFPDNAFEAARMYLALMAYPELGEGQPGERGCRLTEDRKSTRLNSSH